MFDMRRWLKVMFLCCLKGTTTIPPYRALFTRSHSTIRRPARPSQEFIFFYLVHFFYHLFSLLPLTGAAAHGEHGRKWAGISCPCKQWLVYLLDGVPHLNID